MKLVQSIGYSQKQNAGGEQLIEAKSDSTVLLSAEQSCDEIMAGWIHAVETWKPVELTTEERHQFERAALMERQMKEKSFILP